MLKNLTIIYKKLKFLFGMVVTKFVDKGGMMFNKLKDEKIILDLENLVKNCDEGEDVSTSYAIFIKERILGLSGLN